jgi:hypothetical protein
MNIYALSAALLLVALNQSYAGQWNDVLATSATLAQHDGEPLPTNMIASVQGLVCSNPSAVPASFGASGPDVPAGCSPNGVAPVFVDLNQFGREGDVSMLQSQMQAVQQSLINVQKLSAIGSSLAAALVSQAPNPGDSNRLGINMAAFQNFSSIGINYSHIDGPIDINAGIAFNTSGTMYALGRVGAGFSW